MIKDMMMMMMIRWGSYYSYIQGDGRRVYLYPAQVCCNKSEFFSDFSIFCVIHLLLCRLQLWLHPPKVAISCQSRK